MTDGRPRELLVIANETVAGGKLIDTLRARADAGPVRITVVCPINQPREGYVVYEDTRRAAAGRRLTQTLEVLGKAEIPAHGLVVDSDPENAVRDALAQLEPPPDEVIVSTHPLQKSGWLRKNLLDRIRSVAGDLPVEHVVVDLSREAGAVNVLVVANETVVGDPLLEHIRERAQSSPATFLILSPQSDPSEGAHPEAERRLRRTLSDLRADGIEAHGQVAHPDPYTAAMHAVRDERIDEIIVSTFPGGRSGWLRRDVPGRLRKDTGLPVEHVVVEPAEVGAVA